MTEPFQYLNNKRKSIRVCYPCELEYCPASDPLDRNKAYTINISSGGMCLYLYRELSVGQEIEINSNVLPFFCETARVRWVKETAEGNYTVGLEFCIPSK